MIFSLPVPVKRIVRKLEKNISSLMDFTSIKATKKKIVFIYAASGLLITEMNYVTVILCVVLWQWGTENEFFFLLM